MTNSTPAAGVADALIHFVLTVIMVAPRPFWGTECLAAHAIDVGQPRSGAWFGGGRRALASTIEVGVY